MKTIIMMFFAVAASVVAVGGGNEASLGKYAKPLFDYDASPLTGNLTNVDPHNSNTVAKINALYDMMIERVDILSNGWTYADKTDMEFVGLPSVSNRTMFAETNVFTQSMMRRFYLDVCDYMTRYREPVLPRSTEDEIYPIWMSGMAFEDINLYADDQKRLNGVEAGCGYLYVPSLCDYPSERRPVADHFIPYLSTFGIDALDETLSYAYQAEWIEKYYRYGDASAGDYEDIVDIVSEKPHVMAGKLYSGTANILGHLDTTYFTFEPLYPKCTVTKKMTKTTYGYDTTAIIDFIKSNAISDEDSAAASFQATVPSVEVDQLTYSSVQPVGGYEVNWEKSAEASFTVVAKGTITYNSEEPWGLVNTKRVEGGTQYIYRKRVAEREVTLSGLDVYANGSAWTRKIESEYSSRPEDINVFTCCDNVRKSSYVGEGTAHIVHKKMSSVRADGEVFPTTTNAEIKVQKFSRGELTVTVDDEIEDATSVKESDKDLIGEQMPSELIVEIRPISIPRLGDMIYFMFKVVFVSDDSTHDGQKYTWEEVENGSDYPVDPRMSPLKDRPTDEEPPESGTVSKNWFVPCTVWFDASGEHFGGVTLDVSPFGIFGKQKYNLMKLNQ